MSDLGEGRGPAARPATLVGTVVAKLEALSLAHQEGELLGAEDVLLVRFGVSRPTLRQAAKVVEADRLISVRRGLRGGFYAARPNAADAIRAPARYLRLHDATLKHMHAVSQLLAPEVAALAAGCDDAALIAELAVLRDELALRSGEADGVAAVIESEGALNSVVARMTGNPVMVLVSEIAFAFGYLERDLKFYRATNDRRDTRRLQLELCSALLARDEANARDVANRRIRLVAGWIG